MLGMEYPMEVFAVVSDADVVTTLSPMDHFAVIDEGGQLVTTILVADTFAVVTELD